MFSEVDVREDEEQTVKLEEIIEMLVSAGYYRARIKGLANFDKIVGGMTWCIESCYFDVDVDLLFQENLTIGQKIALTEKIVVMLPKMNCPHRIEPHQIQGLDCIHIFPVMQWLVHESMKMREEMAEYVRSFAITHFDKKHGSINNRSETEKMDNDDLIANIKLIKKAYEPRRRFKQKDAVPVDEFSIVSNALLEYGETLQIPQSVINKLQDMKTNSLSQDKEITKEIIERKIQEKKIVEELMKNLSKFDDNTSRVSSNIVGKIVNIQAQEVAKAAEQYASLSNSEFENKQSTAAHATVALEKQKLALESKAQKMTKDREDLKNKLTEIVEKIKMVRKRRQSIDEAFEKMRGIESQDNKGRLQKLEELLIVHDGLKDQENKFRDQCHQDLKTLNSLVEGVQAGEPREEADRVIEYDEQKEVVNRLRLQLAKKNRAIATLTRQLDDVPGRSELTQYQRRFMELYNQVSAKHKETKQYYTLYNTLDDKKLYLSKELSLLNSIQDNYYEAMASTSGKEQFIKQFELIVDGVQRNKAKVKKRCAEETARRDALSCQLLSLMEQQRKYVVAVRQLTIECRKNESLLARLRGP
ncbi:coiled-coil domain-containing protein 93 isoform X2 [Nasonia vitripennis]|uniref:Coiled-coil domain-containing protein 93 n=1 Tax=Nasonia vitripennis TaxID=7425 RepID=A0A7M7LQR6_NASVI|nr:coiled-coil domain-containing protein 93 isoform X2 [Nasonia vitripennis]